MDAPKRPDDWTPQPEPGEKVLVTHKDGRIFVRSVEARVRLVIENSKSTCSIELTPDEVERLAMFLREAAEDD